MINDEQVILMSFDEVNHTLLHSFAVQLDGQVRWHAKTIELGVLMQRSKLIAN